MKNQMKREKRSIKYSKKNRWYEYERYKTYLGSQQRETEVRALSKNLGI